MGSGKPFLVFGKPAIEETEVAEVVDSLRSGWIGTGPKVQRFERMLEDYVGIPEVRCVSSCTAALFLAMQVIVPAMTFIATANAVEHTGRGPSRLRPETSITGSTSTPGS